MRGYLFLTGYVLFVGVASFLQKFAMKTLSAYQVNALMAIGMLITAVPALWWAERRLTIPVAALPWGAPVGLLMAVGSIFYVLALADLPAGLAAALSTSYVVVVVLLSWFFLHEPLGATKIAGLILVTVGVALLSWDASR